MEFMQEVPFFDLRGDLVATRSFDSVPRTYAISTSVKRFGKVEVNFHYFVRCVTSRGVFFVPMVQP